MVNKTRSYAGGMATKVRVLYAKYKEKTNRFGSFFMHLVETIRFVGLARNSEASELVHKSGTPLMTKRS